LWQNQLTEAQQNDRYKLQITLQEMINNAIQREMMKSSGIQEKIMKDNDLQ